MDTARTKNVALTIFTWLLKIPILLAVALVWAVVGAFIWAAVLFRALSIYSWHFFSAVATHQDPSHLHSYLDHAVLFYFRGFRIVAFGAAGNEPYPRPQPIELAIQSFYALLFWGIFAWGYRMQAVAHAWQWSSDRYHQLVTAFQQSTAAAAEHPASPPPSLAPTNIEQPPQQSPSYTPPANTPRKLSR